MTGGTADTALQNGLPLRITPFHQKVEDGDRTCKAGEVEIRDFARGLSGALFVSLPLLFTMEMWEIAKSIPDSVLLLFLGVSLVFNRFFIDFAGFRRRAGQPGGWWDAVLAMGIGMFASTITLWVTGNIGPSMSTMLVVKTIALETIPTSMGAAVATNQLGAADGVAFKRLRHSPDVAVILGTILGGFLFAFNVAPTIEPKVISVQQDWWMVLGTFALSLGAAYMVVAVAQFEERDLDERKIITTEWLEAVISYCFAFLISMFLVWIFGYATPLDPLEVWLPQTVTLAYATSLGGAAGRVVL